MPGVNKVLGEEIMRLWAERYLFQKMNPLQKRLFNWWTNEGFFYVSNFEDTPEGMSAELMLLMGDNAYGIVRNDKERFGIASQIEAKKKTGWDIIPFGVDGYFSLRDTKKNRVYVRALIDENIRNYRLVRFTENEKNGERLLKSVIVIINRK